MTKDEKLLLKPESFFKDTWKYQTYTEKFLKASLTSGKKKPIVIGYVNEWRENFNELSVSIGNHQIKGFISCEEITSEALKFSEVSSIPVQASKIIGKTILAEVEGYDMKKKEFNLSRKKSMQRASSLLHEGDIIVGTIMNITNNNIFVDCCAGKIGMILGQEFSVTKFSSLHKSGFHIGDNIKCKITMILDDGRIFLSRKSAYESYEEAKKMLLPKQNVRVIVANNFEEREGDSHLYSYLVEVEPNVKGLLNTNTKLTLGQKVDATILKQKKVGLKLKL